MAIHSSSSDTPIISISNEDIAADIIRLQGEEVIRLRKELENAQKLNTTAFDLLRSTDDHMSEMQNDFRQRCVQLSFLEGTLVNLQNESAASSHALENLRANLRGFCGLLSPEQPLSHPVPVTQDNIVDEHCKSPSIAGSTYRDDFMMIDDLSTEASITNITKDESDAESIKSMAQLNSITKSNLEEPLLREDDLNNIENCRAAAAADEEAARLTLQRAEVKEAVMTAKLPKKADKEEKYLNPILSVCGTPVQATVVAAETRSSENVLRTELASMQKQLDAALETIHVLEWDKFNESFDKTEQNIEDEQVVQAVIVPASDELADPLSPGDFGSDVGTPTDIALGISVEPLPMEAEGVRPMTIISDSCGSSLASLSSVADHDDEEPTVISSNPELCPQPNYYFSATAYPPIILNIQQKKQKARDKFCLDVCEKAIGYPPTTLSKKERGKLIFSLNDPSKITLILISKNHNTPCKLLQDLRIKRFKEASIILGKVKTSSTAGKERPLHMLGEYTSTIPPALRILQKSDYELLPELTKIFIFDSAKKLRTDIQTPAQLVGSIGKSGGIAVHKVELKVIRSRDVLEKLVAKEACRRGVLLSSSL